MKKQKITNVNSPLQPWLITIRNKKTLQENSFLAFGKSSKSAINHLFKFIPNSFEFVDCYMISNCDFVCNADYRSHYSLINTSFDL